MPLKIILIGNLTIDHNIINGKKYKTAGGSVYFCAKLLENLNSDAILVSSYGQDFPKNLLTKTIFYPKLANFPKTLIFKNIYRLETRIQYCQNLEFSSSIAISNLPQSMKEKVDIVMVAPIINNYQVEEVKAIVNNYKNCLKVLLPQGYFRKIGKNGAVSFRSFKEDRLIIPYFDFVIVSEKDAPLIDKKAFWWSLLGPRIIVTRAERGCTLFMNKKSQTFKAFKVDQIVDVTGAGDIFSAAFTYFYWQNKNIEKAIFFGQAAAALSLRFTKDRLQYTYQDIIDFAK